MVKVCGTVQNILHSNLVTGKIAQYLFKRKLLYAKTTVAVTIIKVIVIGYLMFYN